VESRQASDHNRNTRYQKPPLSTCAKGLPGLRQAAVSSKPGFGPFDHPPARQNLEASGGIVPLDDLDPPVALSRQRAGQFRPGIASIRKDSPQPGPTFADRTHDHGRAVAILRAGRMNHGADTQAKRASHEMPFAALDPFPVRGACVVPQRLRSPLAKAPPAVAFGRSLEIEPSHSRHLTGVFSNELHRVERNMVSQKPLKITIFASTCFGWSRRTRYYLK
jgi:hypothetical protein